MEVLGKDVVGTGAPANCKPEKTVRKCVSACERLYAHALRCATPHTGGPAGILVAQPRIGAPALG